MSIPSPYPVRFHPQCFPHDPIKIGDPFFITIHHRSRGKKKFQRFSVVKKSFFSHHRRLVCRRDVAIFRFFFPRILSFIITSLYGYIFEGRKRHATVRSHLKISSFFFTVVKSHRSFSPSTLVLFFPSTTVQGSPQSSPDAVQSIEGFRIGLSRIRSVIEPAFEQAF